MLLEIEISMKEPLFEQENEIFGTKIFFEFEWLESKTIWLLHVFDHERKPLFLGVKLLPNWPLFSYQNTTFFLIEKNNVMPLTFNTLKKNFVLVAHGTF